MQTRGALILNQHGKAISPRAINRIRALNGGGDGWGGIPYDSADIYGENMRAWNPFLWSPDTEINPNRDRIVSRTRDIGRNDGWASGALTRILDNAIGANLRPIPKPDYRWLAHESGNSGFDARWAHDFSNWAKARFGHGPTIPGAGAISRAASTLHKCNISGFATSLLTVTRLQ
jgi:capsid protein